LMKDIPSQPLPVRWVEDEDMNQNYMAGFFTAFRYKEAMDSLPGMKWVKASERLPEVKDAWYWCKIEKNGFKGAFYFTKCKNFTSLIDTIYENKDIEWLDEQNESL
jgi:hypothetical protein